MFVNLLQKAFLYLREVQDIGLFTAMSDSRLFIAFATSPLYFVMLPFLGLLMTGLALINVYQLAIANNKNIDKWSNALVSSFCAILASVSLYGAVIAKTLGVTFVAGPWVFLSSILLAITHQSAMLALNCYRAYEASKGSSQRMHYIQAALNNLFIVGLLTAVIGAIVFVMILPIAPAIGSACSIAAVTMTAFSFFWRLIPHNGKVAVKEHLHLGKPTVSELVPEPTLGQPVVSSRLFAPVDYSEKIKVMEQDAAKDYLKNIVIKRKMSSYNELAKPQSDKIRQKVNLLACLDRALDNNSTIHKGELLKRYPLAFQSFLAEKGDIEQIVDAVLLVIKTNKNAFEEQAYSHRAG